MLVQHGLGSVQPTQRSGVRPDKIVISGVDDSPPALDDRVVALEAEVDQLRQAAISRQRIGVAVGLLAARFRCGPEQSWQILARLSKTSNIKVRVLAEVFIAVQEGRSDDEDPEILRRIDAQLPPNWRRGWVDAHARTTAG